MSELQILEHSFSKDVGDLNFLHIDLAFPDIYIWKKQPTGFYDDDESVSRTIGLSLKTKLVFYLDRDMWCLKIILLGFGIEITRQWSY